MIVFGIVPGKEGPAECPCVFNGTESVRKLRSVFHGFELRFRIGVVVTHRWSRMAFGNPEIGKKKGNRF